MKNRQDNLLALKKELTQRVEKINKDLHSRKTSGKFSDQVVDRQNDDVLLNLKNEAEHEIEQIDHALIKIKNSLYGICEKCHGEISPERLDIVPFAATCKDCSV